jgi:hypothetical protein
MFSFEFLSDGLLLLQSDRQKKDRTSSAISFLIRCRFHPLQQVCLFLLLMLLAPTSCAGNYIFNIKDVKVVRAGDAGPIVNLGEITIYDADGMEIFPISMKMSSTFEFGKTGIEKCFDGLSGTLCHTKPEDKDPSITFDMGDKKVGRIVIQNRKPDGCDCDSRIKGANIIMTDSADPYTVLWSSTFESTQPTYIFHPFEEAPDYSRTLTVSIKTTNKKHADSSRKRVHFSDSTSFSWLVPHNGRFGRNAWYTENIDYSKEPSFPNIPNSMELHSGDEDNIDIAQILINGVPVKGTFPSNVNLTFSGKYDISIPDGRRSMRLTYRTCSYHYGSAPNNLFFVTLDGKNEPRYPNAMPAVPNEKYYMMITAESAEYPKTITIHGGSSDAICISEFFVDDVPVVGLYPMFFGNNCTGLNKYKDLNCATSRTYQLDNAQSNAVLLQTLDTLETKLIELQKYSCKNDDNDDNDGATCEDAQSRVWSDDVLQWLSSIMPDPLRSFLLEARDYLSKTLLFVLKYMGCSVALEVWQEMLKTYITPVIKEVIKFLLTVVGVVGVMHRFNIVPGARAIANN